MDGPEQKDIKWQGERTCEESETQGDSFLSEVTFLLQGWEKGN